MQVKNHKVKTQIKLRIMTPEVNIVVDTSEFIKVLHNYIKNAPKVNYMLYQSKDLKMSFEGSTAPSCAGDSITSESTKSTDVIEPSAQELTDALDMLGDPAEVYA